MKPTVLPILLTCAALISLHAYADAANTPAERAAPGLAVEASASLPAVRMSTPESPAAAFHRMLAHAPGAAQPPIGAPADALTSAINAALWSASRPASGYASARLPAKEDAR